MSDSAKEGPAETVAEVKSKESPCAELKIAMEKCVAKKGEDSCRELIQAYKECERVLRGTCLEFFRLPIILSSTNPTIPLGGTDGVVLLYMIDVIDAVGCGFCCLSRKDLHCTNCVPSCHRRKSCIR
ncbi:hypothetical protein XELAEV_18037637mg [Xenopus laevis]|uniref:Uncharacterized protein n=1 Tax=Xenopus laevis TaxID=8355 RepID=A0A974HAC5_XENLA|nr:hypothetical protein XELAEV_18037637mg [Xenopus laevis]